jgi:methionine-gamma-lyase
MGGRDHAGDAAVPDRVTQQPAFGDHRPARRSGYRANAGVLTLADNTFATPVNQRPVEFGVDLVWHSATKYLAGHSDASAGVVVGPKHLIDQIWMTSLNIGAVLGPFDAWLVTRGIRTLDLRVRRHNDTAAVIAGHLSGRPEVPRVHYPGLRTHAAHDVAARQMSGFGGVLSVELVGGLDEAQRFVEQLELFQLSASLGSVESLVVHPASMWKAMLSDRNWPTPAWIQGWCVLPAGRRTLLISSRNWTKPLAHFTPR